MPEWKPVRPFDIDHGELDDFSKPECFVLGYELAEVDAALSRDSVFRRPVHAANKDRIEAEARRQGRTISLTYMDNDRSESWMWLEIAPRKQDN